KVKAVDLFEVKDDGLVEHDGAQLRKFTITPRGDSVNKQLFDIFYEAAGIEKVTREKPNAVWQYALITVNPQNSGSVGGYYLIDEQKNLPVYSEMYGTNPDRPSATSGAAGRNIARTKERYYYPEQPTITTQTTLEILQ